MAAFSDKVVVITGASDGIGRALALELARQGPKLVLAARSADKLATAKEEAEKLGATALVVETDVSKREDCERLIARAAEEYGRIDALVNNAGQTMWTRLDRMKDVGIIERLMTINYLGAAWCTYYALPWLEKSRGRIAAVSSVAGLSGGPTRTAYSGSKFAMFGFFDSLRIELMDRGVSVTMIAPDFVQSSIHMNALDAEGNRLGKNPMEGKWTMTSEQCAHRIALALERRERLVVMSARARLARWVKLIAPGLVDRITYREMKKASRAAGVEA